MRDASLAADNPFERVRDLIADQKSSGALCEAEAAGAEWAVDALESLLRFEAKRDAARGVLTDDDFHDLTLGSARGG